MMNAMPREGACIAGSVLEARLERPSFFASWWMDHRHDLAAGSCRRTSVIWVTSPVLGLLDDRGLLTLSRRRPRAHIAPQQLPEDHLSGVVSVQRGRRGRTAALLELLARAARAGFVAPNLH